jgi:filamin
MFVFFFSNVPRYSSVRAYGPGVEPTGLVVGAPANFTVETFSAGKGEVTVVVENPKGQKDPVSLSLNLLRHFCYR